MDNNHSPRRRPKGLVTKILINLAMMLALGVALVWISTIWLDSWTDHGRYALVPQVKGMTYERALQLLHDEGFEVELSDSIYDDTRVPGTVTEQNPKQGTKVKVGRLIYLTVNAFSKRTVALPGLTDMSLRQAQAILAGLGVKNVTVVEVPSDFKNLVIAVKRDGHLLSTGARVPVDARLVLEVGAGSGDEYTDSVSTPADTLTVEHLDLL